jgi:hypothetical protein
MRKNKHELKLEQFSALLPTTWKNDRRCRQQPETFFRVMGNKAKICSALWAIKQKNCHDAEQSNIFREPFSTFKGTVYLN